MGGSLSRRLPPNNSPAQPCAGDRDNQPCQQEKVEVALLAGLRLIELDASQRQQMAAGKQQQPSNDGAGKSTEGGERKSLQHGSGKSRMCLALRKSDP